MRSYFKVTIQVVSLCILALLTSLSWADLTAKVDRSVLDSNETLRLENVMTVKYLPVNQTLNLYSLTLMFYQTTASKVTEVLMVKLNHLPPGLYSYGRNERECY